MRLEGATNAQIISYITSDGLKMKGILSTNPRNLATVVHVHGSCGNFYENDFLPFMAQKYDSAGVNFMSVNNRGHDCMAEAYRYGRLEYIGGYHEIIAECVYDIEGAIKFANQLRSKIIRVCSI